MQSLPPEGSARRDWSLFLAFVVAYGGLAATWGDLGGKTATLFEHHAAQERAIEKLEDSDRARDRERALEDKIGNLTERIATLEATINELRAALLAKRR